MRYQVIKIEMPSDLREKQIELINWVNEGLARRYWETYSSYSPSFAYVCKCCGAEIYGEAKIISDSFHSFYRAAQAHKHYEHDEIKKQQMLELLNEVDELSELNWKQAHAELDLAKARPCPVCGAKLCDEKGFSSRGGGDDATFKNLVPIRQAVEREQATDEVQKFVGTCDLPGASPDCDVEAVKTDLQSLKKYILHLIQMENNIFSLEQRLSELYYQRKGNARAVIFSQKEPALKIRTETKELQIAYENARAAVINAENCTPVVSVQYPVRPVEPILGRPGLFNKKKVLEENEALTAKYQVEMEAYRKKVQRCDAEKERLTAEKRIIVLTAAQKKADAAKAALDEAERSMADKMKALEARPVPEKAVKEILDREIAETEKLLKKTFAARNELYAYDIVFGKYRDVVALSSFYEYLMSGRCASLEGADGAYNIYENEIRFDRVISQLDTVIASLEDIKQNQYMIYQELRKINASLSRLNSTMDTVLTSIQGIEANTASMNEYMEHISQNSDVIVHNTAVTAYYSKVNAELTNALGFMVTLK